MPVLDDAVLEHVSGFDFAVTPVEETPDSTGRWAARTAALADWLLSEWRLEHPEAN